MDGNNCPHLSNSVKILSRKATSILKASVKLKTCAVCEIREWPLLCLHCGVIYCGRYGNQHAIKHWQNSQEHCINLNCETFQVYCYICDSEVYNDTKTFQIQRMISFMQRCQDEEQGSTSDAPSSDYSMVNGEVTTNNNMLNTSNTIRMLRPRTRTKSLSNDKTNENLDQPEHKLNNGNSKSTSSTPTKQNNTASIDGRGRRRSRKESSSRKKVVGLKNLGNTCFMNAVLQSLSNIQEFSHFFKQLPAIEIKQGNERRSSTSSTSSLNHTTAVYQKSLKELNNYLMVEELRKVLICLTDTHQAESKTAISPDELFVVIWKVVPRFRGYQQQDAHEFLRYTLDRVHNELVHLPDIAKDSYRSPEEKDRDRETTSIVTNIFGGALLSEVRCLACTTEYKKIDPFLDLSLDIPENLSKKRTKDGEEKPYCHLSECLKSFVDVEELAESEKYNCNNCKSKQRSTKRFWFKRLPNVLCIHLKRFRWTNSCRTKVDTMIEFPVSTLDMTSYILPDSAVSKDKRRKSSSSSPNIYDLAAIIVHHGTGAGSGHYTAYAIHENQWWHFDDSTVIPVDIPTLKKCKPYILFYVRRILDVPSVNKQQE